LLAHTHDALCRTTTASSDAEKGATIFGATALSVVFLVLVMACMVYLYRRGQRSYSYETFQPYEGPADPSLAPRPL